MSNLFEHLDIEFEEVNKLGVVEIAMLKNDTTNLFVSEKIENQTIAKFSDGADNVDVKSLIVGIEAYQSGSNNPSPSNIRPISGWSQVYLSLRGENLIRVSALNNYAYNGMTLNRTEDGKLLLTGQNTSGTDKNPNVTGSTILRAGTYTLTIQSDTLAQDRFKVRNFNNQNLIISGSGTFSISETTTVRIYMTIYADDSFNNDIVSFMLTFSDDANTNFVTPVSNSKTIDLDRTVYGGTLDVTTGVLTVTQKGVDMGSLTWEYSGANIGFYAPLSDAITIIITGDLNAICSCYKRGNYPSSYNNGDFIVCDSNMSSSKRVSVRDNAYTDATTFKTSVTGQTLVYTLGTPQTYQLTPTQVVTLLGQNNIWVDSGDIINLEYIADTKLYIDNKFEALQNTVLSLGGNI